MKYGYIRVSTRHQDETRQSVALIVALIEKRIYQILYR